jgi:hypothetical protein
MIQRIKNYFLERHIRQQLVKPPVKRRTLPYREVRNIGMLFDASNEHQAREVENFVRKLEKDGKQLTALTFFEKEREQAYQFHYDVLLGAEVSLLGGITSARAQHFAGQAFDVLLCLSTSMPSAFRYLLSASHARFRVGLYHEHLVPFYELMIIPDPKKQTALCADTVYTYMLALDGGTEPY